MTDCRVVVVDDSGGTLEQYEQLNGDLHAYGTAVVRGRINGTIHVHAGSNVLIAEAPRVRDERLSEHVETFDR